MRDDKESFELGAWINEPTELFELSEEVRGELDAKMTELAQFCFDNRIPMVMAACRSETPEHLNIVQRSVLPFGRTNAILLASNVIATGGITDDSYNMLDFLRYADGQHNAKAAEARAEGNKPKLSIVH